VGWSYLGANPGWNTRTSLTAVVPLSRRYVTPRGRPLPGHSGTLIPDLGNGHGSRRGSRATHTTALVSGRCFGRKSALREPVGSGAALVKYARMTTVPARIVSIFIGLSICLCCSFACSLVAEPVSSGSMQPTFVLVPRWIPPGFTKNKSNMVMAVFPHAGTVQEGAHKVPYMFTLKLVNTARSEGLTLYAQARPLPLLGQEAKVGLREVAFRDEPGELSIASWNERGDFVSLAAVGVGRMQTVRFIEGLMEEPVSRK
jgi:hypothetical protein